MPRYEFSDGKSNKFWEIELSGKSFTTTYGRIGAAGQSTTKAYGSEAEAAREHDKLIGEKVRKGYKPVSGGPPASKPAGKAPVPKASGAPARWGHASSEGGFFVVTDAALYQKWTGSDEEGQGGDYARYCDLQGNARVVLFPKRELLLFSLINGVGTMDVGASAAGDVILGDLDSEAPDVRRQAEQGAAAGGKAIGHIEVKSGRLVVAWGPENFQGLSTRSQNAVTGRGKAPMQELDGATGGLGQVVQVKPGLYGIECGTLPADAGFWCRLRRESGAGGGGRPTKTVRWSPPE